MKNASPARETCIFYCPDVIISRETHSVARTIDPVRIIAHVVIGMIGLALFGERRANVRSSIPAISPNTATNIRNINICCISFSSSRKYYLHL